MGNVLVTGGAGFIGSHLADYLLGQNQTVVTLDDLSGGFMSNLSEPYSTNFVRGSILDHQLIDDLFDKWKFDYVYHTAAHAAEILSPHIRRFNYLNNLVGSANLINASVNHDVKCFVFLSSIAVYGASSPPFNENQKPNPQDPYGIAKLAVEQDLASANALFGLPYVVFRPGNVYGPRQNISDRYRNVVGIFMNQALRGERFTIFGNGDQLRAFTYIDDIIPAIATAPVVQDAINRTFNIGGDTPITVNDLSEAVARVMNVDLNVLYLPARHEVKIAYRNNERLESVFGKQTYTGIMVGLERMAEWVRRRGPQPINRFSEIEIKKNLPESWTQ